MVDRRHLLFAAGAAALGVAGAGWSGFRRMGSIEDYTADLAPLRAALPPNPDPRDLIRFATLAANSHNTQAWKFRMAPGRIDLLPDFIRRTPAVDPDDHHLFTSLGCAAENLAIAAAARGQPGALAFDAAENGAVRFDFTTGASRDTDSAASFMSFAVGATGSVRSKSAVMMIRPGRLGGGCGSKVTRTRRARGD